MEHKSISHPLPPHYGSMTVGTSGSLERTIHRHRGVALDGKIKPRKVISVSGLRAKAPPLETPLHHQSVPVLPPVSSSSFEQQHISAVQEKVAGVLLDSTTASSGHVNHEPKQPEGAALLLPLLEEASKISLCLDENNPILFKATTVGCAASERPLARRITDRSFSTATSLIPKDPVMDVPLMSASTSLSTAIAPSLMEQVDYSHSLQGEQNPASLPTSISVSSATNERVSRSQVFQAPSTPSVNSEPSQLIQQKPQKRNKDRRQVDEDVHVEGTRVSTMDEDVQDCRSLDAAVPHQQRTNLRNELFLATGLPDVVVRDGRVKVEESSTGTIAINSSDAVSYPFRPSLVVSDAEAGRWIKECGNDDTTREEERQLLKKLDSVISRLEEMELMNRIFMRIEDAADLEYAKSLPSKVTNVVQARLENYQTDGQFSAEVPPTRAHEKRVEGATLVSGALNGTPEHAQTSAAHVSELLQPPATALEGKTWLAPDSHLWRASVLPSRELTPGTTTTPHIWVASPTPSNDEHDESVEAEIMFKLPKWAPSRDGEKLLFTLAEVQSKVLEDVIDEDHIYPSRCMKAYITEHAEHYVVEAWGIASALQALREKVELFVRKHISVANLRLLFDDEDSFLVDVKVVLRRSLSTLGLRFYSCEYESVAQEGVWVKSIFHSGEVAKALGGLQACFNGCALMAINGQAIHGVRDVQVFVQNAKSSLLGDEVVTLTLCLPKNADLTKVTDLSILNLRRRNGEPVSCPRVIVDEEPGSESRQGRNRISKEMSNSSSELAQQTSELRNHLPVHAPTTNEELIQAFITVMEDVRSVEVTFVISSDEGLGTEIEDITGATSGLYLHGVRENGQVGRLLGKTACRNGAVLWKVSGIIIQDSGHLEKVLEGTKGSRLQITLLLFDGTDMTGIEKESLVQGRSNPRRRDGSVYPLFASLDSSLNEPSRVLNEVGDLAMSTKRHSTIEGSGICTNGLKKNRLQEESVFNSPDGSSIPSEQIDTDDGPSTGEFERRSIFAAYWDFKKKYTDLYQFDYGDTGIHVASGIASMWAQHKLLFGNVCDETCICVDALPRMALNVISDARVKQARKGRPIPNETAIYPRGVLDHFAPRFVPLLKQEYPTETSSQIVHRLVDMWPFHQGSRMFGTRCSSNCDCVDDWDELFGKGDKQKTEEFLRSSRKRSPGNAQNIASTHTNRASSVLRPGCPNTLHTSKRQKTVADADPYASATLNPQTDNFEINFKRPVSKQVGQEGQMKKSRMSFKHLCNKVGSYEVTFDPSSPLGGYFRTETGQNGMSKCRIFSKFSKGQLARDPRITVGTTVTAALIGDTRHDITGHLDLKQLYDDAHESKNRLSLLFENHAMKTGRYCDNYWSVNGSWTGPVHDGWPGCSHEVLEIEIETSLIPQTPVRLSKPIRTVGADNVIGSEPGALEVDERTTITKLVEPDNTCIVLGKPSLRKHGATGTTKKKKVVFSSKDPDKYLFSKDAPVNQCIEMVLATAGNSMRLPLSSSLIDARTETCKETIEVAENRTCNDLEAATTMMGSQDRCNNARASNLPLLEDPQWVCPPFSKFCHWRSTKCKFLALGICRYWHVLPPARPNHYGPSSMPPSGNTSLLEQGIRFKERNGFWTAAYLNHERKTIVYAGGGPPSCMVSSQGVSWYPSKSDAVCALESSVLISENCAAAFYTNRTSLEELSSWLK